MKRLAGLLVLLLLCAQLMAQDVYNSSGRARGYRQKKHQGYDPDRLVLGGGITLAISNQGALLGASPKVGYRFTDFLIAGVGVGYLYSKYPYAISYDQVNNKETLMYIRSHNVFPGIWMRCKVIDPFFISADLENQFIFGDIDKSNLDVSTGGLYYTRQKESLSFPTLLVGAGIRQPLGGRVVASLEALYDVLQNEYTPYGRTVFFRGGIFVGL